MSFPVQASSSDTAVIQVGEALHLRNAVDFKATCQDRIEAGTRNFVLDFSRTGVLDSTGLGSIFSLYRQLTPLGGQIVFAAASRQVQVVVQLTRTYKVFQQYATVESAQESLSHSPPHAA